MNSEEKLHYVVLKTVGHGVMESPLQTPKFIESKYLSEEHIKEYVDTLNKSEFGESYKDDIWLEKYYYQEV